MSIVQLLNTWYIAISIPLEVAFLGKLHPALVVTEIISIFLSIAVLVVYFRTPTLTKGGLTLSFMAVLKSYLRHGLIFDLMGALPLNLLFGIYLT